MSIGKVVEWVNAPGKPLWWRHAVRITLGHGTLSNEQMDILYNLAKMESGFVEKDDLYNANTLPVVAAGFNVEESAVNLIGLGNVENVSTLVSDQTLTFSESGLTAVYGDNGSGKSSYARILKNPCLTRGDVPDILSDIYNPSKTLPSALLTVQVGADAPKAIKWKKGAEADEELKSIRVFDSSSASHYISKEDCIEYKPAGLKLLEELVRACKALKEKTKEDNRIIGGPSVLPVCVMGSRADDFLKILTHSITKVELDAICATPEEIASLDELRKELIQLQTKTPQQLRTKYKSQYQSLEPLFKYFNTIKKLLSDDSVLII